MGSDSDLEAAIDEVGREKVFAFARQNGWNAGGAPKWVWWKIVQQLRDRPTGDHHGN